MRRFPNQSIDFFGALRSRVYDNAIRDYIENKGLEGLGKGILVSTREKFEFERPQMDLVRGSSLGALTPRRVARLPRCLLPGIATCVWES